MIYSVRRFSEEDNQNKKSHALRNTLIGAGALAGGILAGRAGYLGTGVQRGIGKGITSVGSMFGSNKMMQSGFKTQAKAATTNAMNNAKKAMENTKLTQAQRDIAKSKYNTLNTDAGYKAAVERNTSSISTAWEKNAAKNATATPTT